MHILSIFIFRYFNYKYIFSVKQYEMILKNSADVSRKALLFKLYLAPNFASFSFLQITKPC